MELSCLKLDNVAYTEEYQQHRNTLDFVFDDKYIYEIKEKPLSDNKHILRITYYLDESHERSEYRVFTSKTEVLDKNGKKVVELKNIDHGVDFFSVVEHSNGKNYLLCSIDLYGYSIIDLSSNNILHYIPEESFNSHQETFIWCDVYYCRKNNILAVDGCYWAYPSSTLFVDFTNPEDLPYAIICSSYDMANELNSDADVTPVRWNDDGTIVLKCSINDDETEIEKTVDVVVRKK